MSTPATHTRSHRDKRIGGIAAIAVAILVATGVFVGTRERDGGPEAEGATSQLSDAWAGGAEARWTIPRTAGNPEYPLAAGAEQLIVTSVDREADGGRTVIAYDISGKKPQEMWSSSVTVDHDLEMENGLWAGYFIYASRLIDASTGELLTAPWPEGAHVTPTPGANAVVACDQSACAGYDPDLNQVWSADVEDGTASLAITVDRESFVLVYPSVASDESAWLFALDTGEEVTLQEDLGTIDTVKALADGWLVYDGMDPAIITPDGGVQALEPTAIPGRMAMTPGPAQTVEDIRWLNAAEEDPQGRIVGQFDEATCGFTLNDKPVQFQDAGACDRPVSLLATTQGGAAVATLVQPEEDGLSLIHI